MRKIFEQTERVDHEIIHVYENTNNEVFIGNVDDQDMTCIVFSPDEAILFAKEVLRVAKKIKQQNEGIL